MGHHSIKLEDALLGVLRKSKRMDLKGRQKYSRKKLNSTSAAKNLEKIPFVITVIWQDNLEVQLTETVIYTFDSERDYRYFSYS